MNENARFGLIDAKWFSASTLPWRNSRSYQLGRLALLVAIMIGKRIGYPTEPMPPHNLTYTCIGAALLWVGWFGLQCGQCTGSV